MEQVKYKSGERLVLEVSSSPHITGRESVPGIMWSVSATLIPAAIAALYYFGLKALLVIIVCIAGAVAAEAATQKLMNRKITIMDGSAFLTGLLLAFNLPSGLPLWAAALGAIFAIVIVKQIFGGLGYNIFNPALIGRSFLLASWPKDMTTWHVPYHSGVDGVTMATPLALMKEGRGGELMSIFGDRIHLYSHLFWGQRPGCIGETATLLIIIGGVYLIYKKYIDWQIPAIYVGTVGALSFVFGGKGLFQGDPLFHMMAGGLALGAFYMATDMVTIPVTLKGRMFFALGCGILTTLIRLKGGYPEGVCYSILLMNCFTPLIDSKVRPRMYGARQ